MSVLYFLTTILDKVRLGFGMILPIFAEARDTRNWPAWLRWSLHLVLLGLILYGLVWLQGSDTGIGRWLREYLAARAHGGFLYTYWLPVVFMVVYLLCWVGYGLYKLFAADEESSEFPDIERAWKQAVAELERVGIRLDDTENAPPVYLVLGRPAGGMDSLFRASGWNFQYRFPNAQTSRLHVYACFEPYSVFVTVPEATGWTYLCNALNGDTQFAPAANSAEANDPTKTLSFDAGADGGGFGLSASELHEFKTLQRVQGQRGLNDVQADRLEVLGGKIHRGGATGQAQAFTIRNEALRTGERELKFICTLMKRDRWPLCPVNGLLVLVPWNAGEAENTAQIVARELANNLTVARNAFQLHYPTLAAICDIEQARGFGQFRGGFSPEQLKQRIGQRIPLVPVRTDNAPETATLIRWGIHWIAHAIVPVWVLGALRFDPQANKQEGTHPNRDLYLLLREVQRRVPRFAAILSRVPIGKGEGGSPEDLESLPLFGGCYLAGTGDKPNRQAFVSGVFQRMVDDQAAVAWTKQAYDDDRRAWRLTRIGYAVMAVLAVAIGIAAYLGNKS
jgi:hypothetical protein